MFWIQFYLRIFFTTDMLNIYSGLWYTKFWTFYNLKFSFILYHYKVIFKNIHRYISYALRICTKNRFLLILIIWLVGWIRLRYMQIFIIVCFNVIFLLYIFKKNTIRITLHSIILHIWYNPNHNHLNII